MANVAAVWTPMQTIYGHTGAWVWSQCNTGDTLGVAPMGTYRDRSIHVYAETVAGGAWNGSTVTLAGSNQPTQDPTAVVYTAAMHDPQGVAISYTSDKLEALSEITNWVQPTITGGTGAKITISIMTGAVL